MHLLKSNSSFDAATRHLYLAVCALSRAVWTTIEPEGRPFNGKLKFMKFACIQNPGHSATVMNTFPTITGPGRASATIRLDQVELTNLIDLLKEAVALSNTGAPGVPVTVPTSRPAVVELRPRSRNPLQSLSKVFRTEPTLLQNEAVCSLSFAETLQGPTLFASTASLFTSWNASQPTNLSLSNGVLLQPRLVSMDVCGMSRYIVAGTTNVAGPSEVLLFNIADHDRWMQQVVPGFPVDGRVNAVVSLGPRFVACASGGQSLVFNVDRMDAPLASCPMNDSDVMCLSPSMDEHLVISGLIRCCDFRTDSVAVCFPAHSRSVTSLVSTSPLSVLSVGADSICATWDLRSTASALASATVDEKPLLQARADSTLRFIAISSLKGLYELDLGSQDSTMTFRPVSDVGAKAVYPSLAWSHSGELYAGNMDGFVDVYQTL